jgi:hypothetical protein
MTDTDASLRALTRIDRQKRRERRAHDIAVIKAVRRAGLPVKTAVVDGVQIEFGAEPAQTAETASPEAEWDREFGSSSPTPLRQ